MVEFDYEYFEIYSSYIFNPWDYIHRIYILKSPKKCIMGTDKHYFWPSGSYLHYNLSQKR